MLSRNAVLVGCGLEGLLNWAEIFSFFFFWLPRQREGLGLRMDLVFFVSSPREVGSRHYNIELGNPKFTCDRVRNDPALRLDSRINCLQARMVATEIGCELTPSTIIGGILGRGRC